MISKGTKATLGCIWFITWMFAIPLPALAMSMVFNYRPTALQWVGGIACLILWTFFARIITKVTEEVTK